MTGKNSIDFRFGIPTGKDAVIDYSVVEDYIKKNKVNAFIAVVYCASDSVPSRPAGGSYNFDEQSLTPPSGWSTSAELDGTVWMSMRPFYSDNSDSDWSFPVKISGDLLSTLTRTFVAVIYKQSNEGIPDTPTGGSYDFDTKTLTCPEGWSTTALSGENSYYSLRAFYSNGTETSWSAPSPTETANVTLTAANLKVIAANVELTSNELLVIALNIDLQATLLLAIAERISLTTELLLFIADNVTLSSLLVEIAALKINMTTEMVELVAEKVTLTEDNLLVIAKNVTLNEDLLKVVATNVSLAASDLAIIASKVSLSAADLEIIAGKVDITGTLNTTDLTVGGGTSHFYKDGSGSVASGNMAWTKNGDLTLKGLFISLGMTMNIRQVSACTTALATDDVIIVLSVYGSYPDPTSSTGSTVDVPIVTLPTTGFNNGKILYIRGRTVNDEVGSYGDRFRLYGNVYRESYLGDTYLTHEMLATMVMFYDGKWFCLSEISD